MRFQLKSRVSYYHRIVFVSLKSEAITYYATHLQTMKLFHLSHSGLFLEHSSVYPASTRRLLSLQSQILHQNETLLA
jgi:hypothetical protein